MTVTEDPSAVEISGDRPADLGGWLVLHRVALERGKLE